MPSVVKKFAFISGAAYFAILAVGWTFKYFDDVPGIKQSKAGW